MCQACSKERIYCIELLQFLLSNLVYLVTHDNNVLSVLALEHVLDILFLYTYMYHFNIEPMRFEFFMN